MIFFKLISVLFSRLGVAVLVTFSLMAGCSESTDSVPTDSVPTDSVSVVDPLIQNQILVTFDITVPAYQSEGLSIELVWGELNLTALWVGDEYWTASSELPTNKEDLLTVTFYDNNGQTALARFNQEFRTGSNATAAFQISAEQFDADQFDDDGDGVNNLDELIAGSDHSVKEDALLNIVDVFSLNHNSRMSVATDFEARVSEERPIMMMSQEFPYEDSSISLDINIDSEGTGTLARVTRYGSESITLSGTRTHTENRVSWDASRFAYDGDYHHEVNVVHTVTAVDENTRTIDEIVDGSNVGTYQFLWTSTANLTAQLVDGTSMCEPLYGSMSATSSSNDSSYNVTLTTVSKELDDKYWRVVRQTSKTRYVSGAPEVVSSSTSGYFAHNLPNILCDFVDL